MSSRARPVAHYDADGIDKQRVTINRSSQMYLVKIRLIQR